MKDYRFFGIFLGMISLGLLSFFIFSAGYYPIGSVNGSFITSRQFRKDYRANFSYYTNIKAYKPALFSENTDITVMNLQLSVLNQLVDTMVIGKAARQELGKEFDRLLAGKIDRFNDDLEFQRGAETLYGLDFEDFKRGILIPQAEKDLLTARLILRGEKIDEWLTAARKESTVKIFSGDFIWEEGQVKLRDPKEERKQ
ncbi:MAG: hypothetical protein AAB652_01035 [Patescibacteria group bacterium]